MKAKNSPLKKEAVSPALKFILELLCVSITTAVLFTCIFRITIVFGSSMYPTLVGREPGGSGDCVILLSNIICHDYKQGDIVVANAPEYRKDHPLVKRIIATEGQTVDLQEEDGCWYIYIDGEKSEEPYIREPMGETLYPTIEFPAVVPENCYFCMGDNRNNSLDSRSAEIGMIEEKNILGKAIWLAFPGKDTETGKITWSRIGTIRNPE